MVYGDAKHKEGIRKGRLKEKLRRRSPVKVEVAGWVDQGGNREVFDKIRDKQFDNINQAERFILEKYGSGTRPVMKIKSIIDNEVMF